MGVDGSGGGGGGGGGAATVKDWAAWVAVEDGGWRELIKVGASPKDKRE